MAEPSRGAFINGSVDYNGHIDNHDDMVRQVGSTNDLRIRGTIGIIQCSRKGEVVMIGTHELEIGWDHYLIWLERWFESFHIVW
jgi:hypothetical protein